MLGNWKRATGTSQTDGDVLCVCVQCVYVCHVWQESNGCRFISFPVEAKQQHLPASTPRFTKTHIHILPHAFIISPSDEHDDFCLWVVCCVIVFLHSFGLSPLDRGSWMSQTPFSIVLLLLFIALMPEFKTNISLYGKMTFVADLVNLEYQHYAQYCKMLHKVLWRIFNYYHMEIYFKICKTAL